MLRVSLLLFISSPKDHPKLAFGMAVIHLELCIWYGDNKSINAHCDEFFSENTKMYLYFLSFLDAVMAQVVKASKTKCIVMQDIYG